jgi:PEP-CTERM motif
MRILTALAAAAVMAMPASAVTLFSQNFDSATAVNNATNIPGFTVTGGVDVIRDSRLVSCAGFAGRCLDLVGAPNVGSITSDLINFNAGRLITVSFEVSGNQRLTGTDTFNFALNFTSPENIASFTSSGFTPGYGTTGLVSGFGAYSESINRTRPFLSYVLQFVPTTSGTFSLVFGTTGANDGRGPILDNILVDSAVPEPSSWLMLLAGFGMVGIAARRRRSNVAA